MSNLPSSLRRFAADKRGNVEVMFGLTAIVAVGAVGGAVDIGRAYKMKSHMHQVLDVSIISGMTKYKETQDWTLAEAAAQTAFQSMIQGAVTAAGENAPTATFTNNGTNLQGTATGAVNAPFVTLVLHGMQGGAYSNTLSVSASSSGALSSSQSTTHSSKKLEVSIMVDLTGSMGWSDPSPDYNTKIDALRAAGLDILDILLPTGEGNSATTRVAIAPFADFVNAGPWAPAATGLAATGGSYSNRDNLAQTSNGQFTGTYSGLTANAAGSQAGATTSGATYNNGYCANPTTTSAAPLRLRDNKRVAIEISRQNGLTPTSSTPNIEGLIALDDVSGNDRIKEIDRFDGTGNQWHNWFDLYNNSDDTG